jgi:hypothetical protein
LKEEIDISSAAGYLGFLSIEDVSFIITSVATTFTTSFNFVVVCLTSLKEEMLIFHDAD